MKRFLAAIIFLALSIGAAGAAEVDMYCFVDPGPPLHWAPCPSSNTATVNGSVAITLGATFQTVLAANPGARRSLTIQNNNTNGDNCWVFIGAGSATAATSILLGAGGSYQRYFPFVPREAIQVTCATTADTIYVDTQ